MPPRYTVRDVFKMLKKDGWVYMYSRGSHHYFEHPIKPGKVTVPGHDNDIVFPSVLNRILKLAGLK